MHCSLHTYHWRVKVAEGEKKSWTEFLGVSSRNHGPKSKIEVTRSEDSHPTMKDFPATWLTPNGELYNINDVGDSATILAMGVRAETGDKTPMPCIWVNEYGKCKLFGTSLGHYNETVEHENYLNMLANAALWVTGRLK